MVNETNFQEHIVQTCQDIAEILLKLALNTNQSINQSINHCSRTKSVSVLEFIALIQILEQSLCTVLEILKNS